MKDANEAIKVQLKKLVKDFGRSLDGVNLGSILTELNRGSDGPELSPGNSVPPPEQKVEGTSNVDHPAHYNKFKFETIQVIEDWQLNFNIGNTIKYLSRYKFKGKEIEDLEKARFYLDREIATLKAKL